MSKLQDKIAVIIGGGSWIGKEIAKKYASEGSKIFIAGLTLSKLKQTVNEIVDSGGTATCEQLDVRDEEQVANFFKKIETQHGQIDILVNSAAVYPRSTIDSLKLSEWKEVIDTNLTGAFIVLKYADDNKIDRAFLYSNIVTYFWLSILILFSIIYIKIFRKRCMKLAPEAAKKIQTSV